MFSRSVEIILQFKQKKKGLKTSIVFEKKIEQLFSRIKLDLS